MVLFSNFFRPGSVLSLSGNKERNKLFPFKSPEVEILPNITFPQFSENIPDLLFKCILDFYFNFILNNLFSLKMIEFSVYCRVSADFTKGKRFLN